MTACNQDGVAQSSISFSLNDDGGSVVVKIPLGEFIHGAEKDFEDFFGCFFMMGANNTERVFQAKKCPIR